MAKDIETMRPKELEALIADIREKHGKDAGRRVFDALSPLREGDDRGRDRDRRHDDAEDRHQRARDAAARFSRDVDGDIESLLEDLLEECGPELAGALREAAGDSRGPSHWAKDRRERRQARDYRGSGFRHYGDGRRLSRDAPSWGPYVGQPEPPLEDFAARRGSALREETESLGGDRRRAHDRALALDAGASDHQVFRAMFGVGAASIETRGQ
jgi:hypothetical protein